MTDDRDKDEAQDAAKADDGRSDTTPLVRTDPQIEAPDPNAKEPEETDQ